MEKTDCCDHVATTCVCCGHAQLQRSPAVLMPFIAHRVYNWEPALIDESWALQTIPSGHAYALCNSLLCSQCDLLFLDIRFSEREMARLYRNYRDEAYTTLRDHYEPGYRARNDGIALGVSYMREVEAFLQPQLPDLISILDWGGDTGVNTPFKGNAANTVHLYDISDAETTDGVRKVSREVAAQNHYDLIICSNVLEHVSKPRQVLAEIKANMTPITVLYIEVPLERLVKEYGKGTELLAKKRHWHEHVNFFSKESLEALVESVGLSLRSFQVLDLQSEGRPCSQFMLTCCVQPHRFANLVV